MMTKELLLILLCLCLHLAATNLPSTRQPHFPPLSLSSSFNDAPEPVCAAYAKTLTQAIQLFEQKSAQGLGNRKRTHSIKPKAFSPEIKAVEFINGYQMEEIGKQTGCSQKQEPRLSPAKEKSCQVLALPWQFGKSAKQELPSLIRHQNSQISHMLQSEIKIQTQTSQDTSNTSSISPTDLIISLLLLALAATLAIYSIANAYRQQKEGLQNQLTHLLTEKEEIRVDLSKQIECLKQKSQFYEVFWDKLVTEVYDKKCYDHLTYQGRFLNQQTYVYVVKTQGIDILTVQRKLNKLLTCSHSRLSKLYFYVKEGDHLLAFTQKIVPLASQQLPQVLNVNANELSKRSLITEIIETIDYLQAKIELKWLPLHSIQLQYKNAKESPCYQFKINAIPCLFRKMPNTCGDDENDTCPEDIPCFVRTNIAALFHLILMNGKPLVPCQLKKMHQTNQQYVQFLNFILYEAKAVGHTHELLFKQVKQHPFLWDTTRKILFLSDFSNFIETHLDQQKIEKMQEYARLFNVVQDDWGKPFHFLFAQEINNYRKYDFSSMRDLVRMIRNKLNHFHQIPKEVRVYVGKTPQKFMEYCLLKFPKLLYFAYNYTRKKKWRLHVK